jgi:hypothetical protein
MSRRVAEGPLHLDTKQLYIRTPRRSGPPSYPKCRGAALSRHGQAARDLSSEALQVDDESLPRPAEQVNQKSQMLLTVGHNLRSTVAALVESSASITAYRRR